MPVYSLLLSLTFPFPYALYIPPYIPLGLRGGGRILPRHTFHPSLPSPGDSGLEGTSVRKRQGQGLGGQVGVGHVACPCWHSLSK